MRTLSRTVGALTILAHCLCCSPTPEAVTPPAPLPKPIPTTTSVAAIDPTPETSIDASAPPPPPAEEFDAGYALIPEGTGARHPPKLTGACVNVLADVKKKMNGGSMFEAPKRVDLDGDGKLDWIVTTDAAVNYSGYVYITRGACGVIVGQWEGLSPDPVKTWANGVLDLEVGTPCKPSCCPSMGVGLFRFDGIEYKKIATRIVKRDCASVGAGMGVLPSP